METRGKGTNERMGPYRKLTIGIILIFCLVEGVYVSIPDFCYDAPAWAIMLWGESTQWWSEMTWLLLFGVFSITLVYLTDFSKSFRNAHIESYQRLFRIIMLVAFLSLLWNYSAIYFRFDGWADLLILDSRGWLHGIFYLGVALEGLWLFGELLAFMSKIVPKLRDAQFQTK